MKITIVTTVRDAIDTIETCLQSVSMQKKIDSGFEVEHIIADGASVDGTVDTIFRSECEVDLVSEPDQSIYEGMNKGIRRATGEIIGTLNADDFFVDDDALRYVHDAMESQAVDICHGNVLYVSLEDPRKVIRVWRGSSGGLARMRMGWMPPHPTLFVRRRCYERFGLYREDLGTAADYEMIVRLLARERLNAVYLPDLWVAMRVGGASGSSLGGRINANRTDRRAWVDNGLRPGTFFRIMKPAIKLPQYLCIGAHALRPKICQVLDLCRSRNRPL